MAENSAISWTKSTFNPWIGCTKVGPGCDHCYAEKLDATGRFGPAHWGPGVARRRTSPGNWAEVRKWNKKAPQTEFAGRKGFWPVFTASLADVFDNEVPEEWRTELWQLMRECTNLTFIVVTKRIGNAAKMLPKDWGDGYPNVWLIATVVDQDEADRDVPKLLQVPAAVRGLSVEPMLGPMDLGSRGWLYRTPSSSIFEGRAAPTVDWVIVGGESLPGGNARPMEDAWARSLSQQCADAGVAFHFKQLGHWLARRLGADGKGKDPAEWPDELRVQEFPDGVITCKRSVCVRLSRGCDC